MENFKQKYTSGSPLLAQTYPTTLHVARSNCVRQSLYVFIPLGHSTQLGSALRATD